MDNYELEKPKVDLDLTLLNKNTSLSEQEKEIVKSIIEADSKQELQKQFDLFNIAQSKKNALRIVKLDELATKAEDEMDRRLTKRSGQMSNRDLLDYHQAINNQIERSRNNMNSLQDKDTIIQVGNSSQTEVNINLGTELSKDSKENVVNAIKSIINILQESEQAANPVVLPDLNEEYVTVVEDNE